MNKSLTTPRSGLVMAWGICCAFLILVLVATPSLASDPTNPERLARQIGVMERTIDRVLVDSPNFLVTSGRNTCGFYVPDFGVVFTFNSRLVDEWYTGSGFFFDPRSDVTITRDEDGERQIIIRRDGKHWNLKRALGLKGKDIDWDRETAELYEDGKAELIEMLLDEGANLSAIPDGQYVMICGRMNDSDLRHEKDIQRVTLKAKVDDLKAYDDNKLSESEMKSRIVIVES